MRARRGWLLLLPVVVALLASCLSVPTSGPVVAGKSSTPVPSGPVEIEPESPARDAPPQLVVEGFLHAMAAYGAEYAVAREYLAEEVRASWQPERAVLVYGEASPVERGDSVVLEAPLVGVVGPDGAYTASQERYRIDFEMVRDAQGQWRIGNPPPGLLVSQYLFERFYDDFDVYFFDPGLATVVPDPVYLPRGQQSATTLVNALLDGPTRWLEPAVVSALPDRTQLGLSIPVTPEGVAEVSFDDSVSQLTPEQRSRAAAQVVWTLRQLPQVSAVRLMVDGAPFAVPDQGVDGTVPVEAYDYLAPVPAGPGLPLHVALPEGVHRVQESTGAPAVVPLEGPLGARTDPVAAMAVSWTGQVAVVSLDRSRVEVAEPVAGAPLETVLSGASGLLTPQYTRLQELWLTESSEGTTRVHVVRGGEVREVSAPALAGSTVLDLRVSPDGTRLAVVRAVEGGGTELGTALVRRGEEVSVESWQSVPLATTAGSGTLAVQAVTWADATTLLLLARSGPDSQLLPWLVDEDGAEMTQVGAGGWEPVSLHAAPDEDRASAARAAAVGAQGQLWVRQGDYRWPELLTGVTAAAYPG